MEWTAPDLVHLAPGVLGRFGALTEICQHRIGRPVERAVGGPDDALESLELTARAQALELLMRIEDQRGPGKATRRP